MNQAKKQNWHIPVYSLLTLFLTALLIVSCIEKIEDDMGTTSYRKGHDGKSGGNSQPNTLITGSGATVNALQSTFPEAGTYTVQFSVTPPSDSPAGVGANSFNVEALISWQLEGNTLSRRVSVGNGVSVSGTAQGVTVQLIEKTANVGQPLGLPYVIVVSVTPGVRAAQSQLPTLMGVSTGGLILVGVGPGALATWNLPVDAGALGVQITAASAADPTNPPVNGRISQKTPVSSFKVYRYNDADVNGFVPLIPNATQVVFLNASAVDTLIVTLTWAIDG